MQTAQMEVFFIRLKGKYVETQIVEYTHKK